ncbi:MAG TPA: histidinol-phosphate transaminase [Dermatophilaceae bacterium]
MSIPVSDLIRPDLRGLMPYGAPQLDVAVALNTNENSYAVPQDVADAIVSAVAGVASGLNRYPDREFVRLREALAAYLSAATGVAVTADQMWAGNGSNEVLQHLLQAFGGPDRVALGFTPAYSMHPIITRTTGTGWVDGRRGVEGAGVFDLDVASAVAQVRRHDPDIVFLCSPNNPTGTALGLDVVEAVYAAAPRAIVVVDEAYAEFARFGTPSALTLLEGRGRLVVTRTMSKAFALAGGRLGYLAADPELTAALRLVRLPYHLSCPTQAIACVALEHAAGLLATVELLKVQRDRIVADLAEMGLEPVPSDANFVLFGGLVDERVTWRALLDHGILVRDVGLAHHLRVTAGTPAETGAFLEAMRSLAPTHRQEPPR